MKRIVGTLALWILTATLLAQTPAPAVSAGQGGDAQSLFAKAQGYFNQKNYDQARDGPFPFRGGSPLGPDDSPGQAAFGPHGSRTFPPPPSNSPNWRRITRISPRGRKPRRTWGPVITWRTSTAKPRRRTKIFSRPTPRVPRPRKHAIGTPVPCFHSNITRKP